LREDRLNDEMVLNKLPAPRKRPADSEGWGDETDRIAAMSVVLKYEKHLEELRKNEKFKNLRGPHLTEDDKYFLSTLDVAKYMKDHNGERPPAKIVVLSNDMPEADLADPRFFKEFEC
jgi:hypothetical protein